MINDELSESCPLYDYPQSRLESSKLPEVFMRQETLDKRLQRYCKKKAVIDGNNYGKRIKWVREKLGLTVTEIAKQTEIPRTTVADWEAGVRTLFYEEIFILATFFEKLWRLKFKESAQSFEGSLIKTISTNFIFFGSDPTLEKMIELKKANDELIKKYELERLAKERAENQLALFST